MFNNNRHDDEEDMPGFRRQRLYRYYADEEEISNVELLLPSTAHLLAHAKSSRDRSEKEQTQFHAAKLSEPQESDNKNSDSPAVRSGWVSSKKTAELEADEERERLRKRMEVDATDLTPSSVEIYAWDEPMRLIENVRTVDRDAISRNKKLFTRLSEKGHRRLLANPDADSDGGLRELLAEHPNFKEVIHFVRDQLALTTRMGKALRIPPILLLGPPGIGKTHFSNSLAKVLGTTIHRLSFDAAHASSALLGSDKNWGNSTWGLLFEAVCLGVNANPLILLDEIDKARTGESYQHPLASLHSLLEPVSSGNVKDISLDYPFDASHVLWLAAANDHTSIPVTLRSRFAEFWIDAPTGADALQLAQGLLKRTHATMSLDDFKEPGYAFARLLAHLTAREQSQALTRAYASAIANGRNHLIRHDLPAEVLLDDVEDSTPTNWLH